MGLVPLLVVLVLGRAVAPGRSCVFVVAGLTDLLDGFVARHSAGSSTTLGAMLDPVADKLLADSSFVLLTWGGVAACTLPVWLTVTLLFRDVMLLVGVLVITLTLGPVDFPPSRLGKVSTALNVATGAVVLAANATGECPEALRWLYQATLACLIATTLHYIYLANARPPRGRGSLGEAELLRKYSSVRGRPSASGTFGSQPRSVRARVMSGWRTLGSSTGSGRVDDPAARAGERDDRARRAGGSSARCGLPMFTGSDARPTSSAGRCRPRGRTRSRGCASGCRRRRR